MSDGETEKKREREIRTVPGEANPRLSFSPSLLLSYPICGLLLLTTFLLCVFPLTDTDFWWHLRTGQLIWERGTIPRTDWYLFSDSDRPWIDLHWGFQLLITGLYSVGGVNLVILVKAAVISLAVGLCWFATGRELPEWLKAVLWIPAVICITGRGYERPEMLSQLFLAMWLWIAFQVERRPKWIWTLPAIQLVWINCHALFVLGLVVGACLAVDFVIRAVARGRFGLQPLPAELRATAVAASGGLCGVTALINPYFLTGALFPLVLYRKFSVEREIYKHIGEFQRPYDFFYKLNSGWENIYLDAQLILVLLTFGSLLALLLVYRRWSPFRWLLCLGFTNLAWDATRNVNIFALVSATVLTANAADLWRLWLRPATDVREKERKREGENFDPSVSPSLLPSHLHTSSTVGNLFVGMLLLAWMAVTVTGVWGAWTGEKKPFGLGEKPFWFAHEAVEFAGQPGFPERAVISHIGLAATYIFHHGPDKKVLLDPRLEVARPETFRWQDRILQQMAVGDRSWELLLRDSTGNLPVLILDSRTSRPSINGLLNTPGWKLVYADPSAAVFLSERQATELKLPPASPKPLMYPP